MFAAPFDYHRPQTLDQAVSLLAQHGDDAKVLAGGHSLIPAMRLRLAQPKVVIDLGGIRDLRYIRERDGGLAIGAMTTHYAIESSLLVRERCPLLTEAAPVIGDVQVRNKGTIGGSLAHADPAADWPACVLALEAELEIAGPSGRRTVRAPAFFVDMLQTALKPDEILAEIRVPATARSVAYVKMEQKASGFALVGVAAVIEKDRRAVRVGVTGVAPAPYRASAVERALAGQQLTSDVISAASRLATDGVRPLGDIHASPEFRAHLAAVNTARALTLAMQR